MKKPQQTVQSIFCTSMQIFLRLEIYFEVQVAHPTNKMWTLTPLFSLTEDYSRKTEYHTARADYKIVDTDSNRYPYHTYTMPLILLTWNRINDLIVSVPDRV